MTPGLRFGLGFAAALAATLAASMTLAARASTADTWEVAFWPILGTAAAAGLALVVQRPTRWVGVGVVCGTATSLVTQVALLFALIAAGGGR
jgi:hypothetical protein